jgi:hypothetical protein
LIGRVGLAVLALWAIEMVAGCFGPAGCARIDEIEAKVAGRRRSRSGWPG